jgi:uncharacterized protein
MDLPTLALFLVTALVGSYVQSVTGFAMGMIMIAVMVGSGRVAVPVIAAVVSLLSFVNIVFALRGNLRHLEVRLLGWVAVALLPAVWTGVWLLGVLDRRLAWLLELLLGSFIVLGSLSMMLRPRPRSALSKPWSSLCAGFAGGVLGGMFAASGPVMSWFVYRQPLPIAAIRATLLAVFALATVLRTAIVAHEGGLTAEVWRLALAGLPLVFIGALAGRNFAPPLSDAELKRFAFALMLVMGAGTIVRALSAAP